MVRIGQTLQKAGQNLQNLLEDAEKLPQKYYKKFFTKKALKYIQKKL